jgi:hypothetical protein
MVQRLSSPAGRIGALLLALALLVTNALPALGSVTLTTFTATARSESNTIRVFWSAATELDTASYQLFRADSATPTDWGAPIHQVAAGGSVSSADYEYVDASVTAGVSYYYRLVDIAVGGAATPHGPVSARLTLPGEVATATITPSPTLQVVPTATTGAGGGFVPTATSTLPPPTATRQFANTPTNAPAGTPVLTAPTSAVVAPRLSPTPLPGAAVATPTGQPVIPTVAPLASPLPSPAITAVLPTAPPTAAVVAQEPGAGLETPTSVPTREVTPIIFAASETREAQATADSEQTVAAQGRNTGAALAVGGAALGLAGIGAAVVLFLKSRKA